MTPSPSICCANCKLLDRTDPDRERCTSHTLSIPDRSLTFCCDFQSAVATPINPLPFNLDPDSFYLWIENLRTHDWEPAALASIDFVRTWSLDEYRSMRDKRIQLRQFFKQANI